MEKHWTAYLPEAGKIMKKSKDIQYQYGLLVQAIADVHQLVRKIADLEDKAFQIARTDWTIEEIAEAKRKAKQKIT
jgi:hypothetical protein